MKKLLILITVLAFWCCEEQSVAIISSVEGCTDPSSSNYNPVATIDDGSCEP